MVILEFTYPKPWKHPDSPSVWGARCWCYLGDFGNSDPRSFKVYFCGGDRSGYVTQYRFLEMGRAFKALKKELQFRDVVGLDSSQEGKHN